MKGLVLRSLSGETEPYSLLLLVSSTTTGTGREILRRYSEGQNIFGLLPHLCTNRLHRGNFCTAEETGAVLFITKRAKALKRLKLVKALMGNWFPFQKRHKENQIIFIYQDQGEEELYLIHLAANYSHSV